MMENANFASNGPVNSKQWPVSSLHSLDYEYVTRAACLKSVQYIDGNNRVSKGAEAVFQLFHTAKKGSFLFTCYRRIPIFRIFTEFIYSWVARNRHLFS